MTRRGDPACWMHLAWLDARHGILEGLYVWDHDAMGYRAGRTCTACGTRSAKHAVLDDRHSEDCHLRPVEEALGMRVLGESTGPGGAR